MISKSKERRKVEHVKKNKEVEKEWGEWFVQ
jgi:hypothetical protein